MPVNTLNYPYERITNENGLKGLTEEHLLVKGIHESAKLYDYQHFHFLRRTIYCTKSYIESMFQSVTLQISDLNFFTPYRLYDTISLHTNYQVMFYGKYPLLHYYLKISSAWEAEPRSSPKIGSFAVSPEPETVTAFTWSKKNLTPKKSFNT